MADVIQTIQACSEGGDLSIAEWLQLAATVIGLGVAIAVPTVLHVRDAKERKMDRDARARTHAIHLLPTLQRLARQFEELLSDPDADVRSLGDRLATLTTSGSSAPAPKTLEAKIDYLNEHKVQPAFKGMIFHELGDAAAALQVFLSDWNSLALEARVADLLGNESSEVKPRLSHAMSLISKAIVSMQQLFPDGFEAKQKAD